MYIIDYVQLKIYINNFGGTKLKRNYISGYANKKGWIPLAYIIHIFANPTANKESNHKNNNNFST
jgi:hypothetical protein